MLKNCSPKNGSRLRRVFSNLAIAFVLLLIMAMSASAYTLVFRDSRRIEIPSEFTLTKMTLTYEVSPGFSKTIQLVMIDVAKTERVNNEAPGSFFRHAAQAQVAESAPPPTKRASRTLTNIDLEPIRQRRIESERNYAKRRIELGLPSIEETRQRQALEEESTLALVHQRAAEQARQEAYWRDRASALRSEIISVDAQIDYLRGRLPANRNVPLITYGSVATVWGSRWFNPGIAPRRQRNPMQRSMGLGASLVSPYAFPIQPFVYGDSYEDAALRDNLNELLVRRAGLESLWRQMEREARVARVPQVWLLP